MMLCTMLVTLTTAPILGPADSTVPLWRDGKPIARLILPTGDDKAAALARSTINDYLQRSFGVELGSAPRVEGDGPFVVLGTPDINPALAALVKGGLKLTTKDIGDEGFQLCTHEAGGTRCIVVYGRTPRAVKHGCQELVYFRLRATGAPNNGAVEWPLDVVMKPAWAYRGVYILPCWAAHDSFESWQRVLRFDSELTINRNWLWLDGFPVAGHTGAYAGTDLADAKKVQALLDQAAAEDMKTLIGGGWFNWHHAQAVGSDLEKGRDYYLQYIDAFHNFDGFYIEPTGEGAETKTWRPQCAMLIDLIHKATDRRPDFEFALAIGKFNNDEYLKRMAELDPKRVYWWWCWGDPVRDQAKGLFPSIVRWHVITRMSDFHGSMAAPDEHELPLAGIATSYDPGQGFGNPWNGWGKLGVDTPRNFDPYDVPYFAHQYFYRERCWNPSMSEVELAWRLHRRLFDADAPPDAGMSYWWLSKLTLAYALNQRPTAEQLAGAQKFLDSVRGRDWTPRMKDTIARMEDAMKHLRAADEAGRK